MRRGDVIKVAGTGDFAGKPRPAVVVQANEFCEAHGSLTVIPLTSQLHHSLMFRVPVPAGDATGLQANSEAQVDKVQSVRRDRTRGIIGAVDLWSMQRIDQALREWLSL